MTTTPMPWPKRPRPIWVGARNGGDLLQAEENARYERAMKEAALSRLRIAVEALGTLAAQTSGKPGSTARADCMAAIANTALSLCDLPANDGDGGAG